MVEENARKKTIKLQIACILCIWISDVEETKEDSNGSKYEGKYLIPGAALHSKPA